MSNDKEVLMYLEVQPTGHGFYKVEASPVWREHPDDTEVKALGLSEPLADLYITASGQVGEDKPPSRPFVAYKDLNSVDLQRAEVMVRQLKRIEDGLSAKEDGVGPAGSFSEYVYRVAMILGINTFGAGNPPAWSMGVAAIPWMDRQIREMRRQMIGAGV